ncbi:MAG: nuclear transport factor 2 family protein [Planctomycetes bacterium]|nr:nuclear transport factor 2 family protein [Planctomycetota bacterium]
MPTSIFRALLFLMIASGASCSAFNENQRDFDLGAIDGVLNAFHDAAARGDGDRYFSLLAKDAIFLGTDPKERWTKQAFKAWAAPYFQGDSAWIFFPRDRTIYLSEKCDAAWFDEVAFSEHYGACRGTGALEKIQGQWKITQYNLTLPIPNDLMKEVVERINDYEREKEKSASE